MVKSVSFENYCINTHGFESLFIHLMKQTFMHIKNFYRKDYKSNSVTNKTKNISINETIVISNKKVVTENSISQKKKGSLYKKLLGAIIKKGKKTLAKKALNNSLYIASKLYKISSYRVISKILGKIKCYAEIRKVTKRKMTTLIPFPVSKSRQKFLKVKWFLHGTKENKSRISFSYKLLKEFEKNFEKPRYIKSQRTIMNNLLIKNVSNAHFRWVSR